MYFTILEAKGKMSYKHEWLAILNLAGLPLDLVQDYSSKLDRIEPADFISSYYDDTYRKDRLRKKKISFDEHIDLIIKYSKG